MQCAPDSARWPLLQFGPETLFFFEAECYSLPHSITAPAGRALLLAQLEQDLARGRRIEAPVWAAPAGCESFFGLVRDSALRAGGLRVFSDQASPPVEALAAEMHATWSELFSIVRVGRAAPFAREKRSPDVLIYCNPAGEALPEARREAEELLSRYAGKAEAFFRTLSREELEESIRRSSLVFYSGHAKLIEGHVAIPSAAGWMPLISRGAGSLTSKAFILNACLEDGARFAGPGGLFIHPIARIADRPSAFLFDLLDSWKTEGELGEAFRNACILDAKRGDVRRFVYRMQGHFWF